MATHCDLSCVSKALKRSSAHFLPLCALGGEQMVLMEGAQPGTRFCPALICLQPSSARWGAPAHSRPLPL